MTKTEIRTFYARRSTRMASRFFNWNRKRTKRLTPLRKMAIKPPVEVESTEMLAPVTIQNTDDTAVAVLAVESNNNSDANAITNRLVLAG